MKLATWNLTLHHPHILENHGMFFLFVFIAHDVAGVGGGDPQQLIFHIRNEFTALDACQRDLDRLLVFDFVILSLDRNAPATKATDLAVTVERHGIDAVFAAAGPENLINDANSSLDFVERL